MRTCKVTCGPHYDADTTVAVLEPKSYILFHEKGIMNYGMSSRNACVPHKLQSFPNALERNDVT